MDLTSPSRTNPRVWARPVGHLGAGETRSLLSPSTDVRISRHHRCSSAWHHHCSSAPPVRAMLPRVTNRGLQSGTEAAVRRVWATRLGVRAEAFEDPAPVFVSSPDLTAAVVARLGDATVVAAPDAALSDLRLLSPNDLLDVPCLLTQLRDHRPALLGTASPSSADRTTIIPVVDGVVRDADETDVERVLAECSSDERDESGLDGDERAAPGARTRRTARCSGRLRDLGRRAGPRGSCGRASPPQARTRPTGSRSRRPPCDLRGSGPAVAMPPRQPRLGACSRPHRIHFVRRADRHRSRRTLTRGCRRRNLSCRGTTPGQSCRRTLPRPVGRRLMPATEH